MPPSSTTLDSAFCLDALDEALCLFGKPDIFNLDQSRRRNSRSIIRGGSTKRWLTGRRRKFMADKRTEVSEPYAQRDRTSSQKYRGASDDLPLEIRPRKLDRVVDAFLDGPGARARTFEHRWRMEGLSGQLGMHRCRLLVGRGEDINFRLDTLEKAARALGKHLELSFRYNFRPGSSIG
jgi:hypothetical protein